MSSPSFKPLTSPVLVLMAGLPGTGKSTLARAIGNAVDWSVIDKDVIITTLLNAGIEEEIAQPASYAVMFALGADALGAQRRSIILDSPAGLPISVSSAQRIAADQNAILTCILCLAGRDTRNHRLAHRTSLRSQPVRVSATTGDGRARFSHLPEETLTVDTTQPLDVVLDIVLAHLRQIHPATPDGINIEQLPTA